MSSTTPTPPPRLCLTCSSTLSTDYDSSTFTALPSSSEKPYQPPISHPCGHEVCGVCLARNRRLARDCILCESVLGNTSAAPVGRTVNKRRGGTAEVPSVRSGSDLPAYRARDKQELEDEGDFVLGDDSDEEEEEGEEFDTIPLAPALALDGELPPAYGEGHDGNESAPTKVDEKREQNSIHYIRPEETLLGLSMKYNVDGRLLCALNRLPPSTLTTTPSLLHTLPFLLLPPTAHSQSTSPLLSQQEEHRRLILRRFQVHTRCAEWAMARAYVQPVFDRRDKEVEFVRENRRARVEGEGEGEVRVREGGELEEALEAWERDQGWEREQIREGGKGKGPVGSRIKSTGQVEARVKGWGWK